MLTKKQIKDIRNILQKSKTPFYFFDGDPDGLCSFLLLMRKYQKGDFECVLAPVSEEYPYITKSREIYSDLVVVLDRANLTQKAIDSFKTEVLWIDHHPPIKRQKVHYYNPRLNKINVPTTYMAYQISQKDLWIAVVGTIADYYFPSFSKKFSEKYPDILPKNMQNIDKILFETKLGELIKIFSFNLHGSENAVRKNVEYFLSIKDPYEILNKESEAGEILYRNYEKMSKKYNRLLKKALREESNDFLLFTYNSQTGFSSDLSLELLYRKNAKVVVVAKESKNSDEISMSLRSREINLHECLNQAFKGLNGSGGGHEHACGANVKKKDFEPFINQLYELIHNLPNHSTINSTFK